MAERLPGGAISRREALRAIFGIAGVGAPLALGACSRGRRETAEVVLYSSIDDFLWFELKPLFESETGIRVLRAGDTEATKTFGLMQRLLSARGRARADVWWSSEVLSTIRLAREGVLACYTTRHEADFPDGWPGHLRGTGGLWYAFALRARIIAFNPELVRRDEVPRTLSELTHPRLRGRVAIADPRFGTTRTHVSAIGASDGAGALRVWLDAMKRNDVQVLAGNAMCARAVAQGDVDVALCDTDDVWALQRRGVLIDPAYEEDLGLSPPSAIQGRGPLLIPNTVAIVANGPNPAGARALADFILSERVERRIAGSDSRNIPIRPAVRADYPELLPPAPWTPDWERVADAADEAVGTAREALGL